MSYQATLSKTVSPYLIWFLLHKSQTSIAMLNFQGKIASGAGYDSWISVLITGMSMHLIVILIFYILKHAKKGDIISLNVQLFGKIMGTLLNWVILLYLFFFISYQLISYAQVIQTLVFPNTPNWGIALVLLLMFVYIVSGGIRVITGISFCFVLIPSLLTITLLFPLQYANWRNFLPIFNHTLHEYTYSAVYSVPLYMGVELLLFYYPFIRDNANAGKWAHIGVIHTYVLYLIITFVSFAYFNLGQINSSVWPTIGLSKIISFSFLERFDYFYIFNWIFAITPPCCLVLWSCSRIVRSSMPFSGRVSLWIAVTIVFSIVVCFKSASSIEIMSNIFRYAGSIMLFGYVPLLALYVFIYTRFQKQQRNLTTI